MPGFIPFLQTWSDDRGSDWQWEVGHLEDAEEHTQPHEEGEERPSVPDRQGELSLCTSWKGYTVHVCMCAFGIGLMQVRLVIYPYAPFRKWLGAGTNLSDHAAHHMHAMWSARGLHFMYMYVQSLVMSLVSQFRLWDGPFLSGSYVPFGNG